MVGTYDATTRTTTRTSKKQMVKLAKQQLRTCITLFLDISFPFLHDYDVKMPNFACYGGQRQATTIYFSFWAWTWSLENSTSGGFSYNWQSKWVGIIAIKTERTFLSPSRRWILKSLVPVRGLRGCQAKKPLRTTCNSTLFSTSLRLQLI